MPPHECGQEPGIPSSRASANPICAVNTVGANEDSLQAEAWMEGPAGLVRILLRASSVCQTTAPTELWAHLDLCTARTSLPLTALPSSDQ